MRKIAGVAGRLAQKNAARNPRRTATTAAALMIGLALVSTALVVGESVKATIGSTFERSAKADYYLTDDLDEVDFPATLAGELRQSDVVAAATGFTHFDARVDGTVTDVVGFDFDQIDAVLDLDVTAGGFDRSVANPVVVSVDEATAIGAGVGDAIAVEFANGSQRRGDDRRPVRRPGDPDRGLPVRHQRPRRRRRRPDAGVAGRLDRRRRFAGRRRRARRRPVRRVPVRRRSRPPTEFRQRVDGMVDQVLTMVNVMVALAVIIALIGIANTLALSVFERTRELGLVRAVGMTRRQLRRMVRFEAALVATFGATLGVGLGLLFGFGVVAALPASFASGFSVPVVPIVVVMLVAAVRRRGRRLAPRTPSRPPRRPRRHRPLRARGGRSARQHSGRRCVSALHPGISTPATSRLHRPASPGRGDQLGAVGGLRGRLVAAIATVTRRAAAARTRSTAALLHQCW